MSNNVKYVLEPPEAREHLTAHGEEIHPSFITAVKMMLGQCRDLTRQYDHTGLYLVLDDRHGQFIARVKEYDEEHPSTMERYRFEVSDDWREAFVHLEFEDRYATAWSTDEEEISEALRLVDEFGWRQVGLRALQLENRDIKHDEWWDALPVAILHRCEECRETSPSADRDGGCRTCGEQTKRTEKTLEFEEACPCGFSHGHVLPDDHKCVACGRYLRLMPEWNASEQISFEGGRFTWNGEPVKLKHARLGGFSAVME